MPAPDIVLDLIQRFERNIDAYRSGQYNETQVRLEFVDPFFKALGWDIHNEKGYAEGYKDVIHEESVKIGGATKAPDYSFRIGGVRKFFVETKKPSVNLKEDASPAYQLRRYAWSAKLPLSILTDFEELVIYDCRVKPRKNDFASTTRVKYLTYKDYETRWDEIADILSRDAVLKGSFDKFAESTKAKKGTAEVDDEFLHEIDSWRTALAKNIALRNPSLSQRELNYAVQVTIDRIIFLRICEDRGIEEYGKLMALQNGQNVYKRLVQLFYRADERYNSGLFHFQSERDRPTPVDELTPGLDIDDKVLADILKTLYYPQGPYEFSVLPADILGQVYEQFLGKVIRLTEGHQAKVEEKPEVKKAGGVYYTPTYIVDYIVKNTLGRLLDGKTNMVSSPSQGGVGKHNTLTPKQVSKLRILDPACGSGSFLLGAYQYLLDWHLQWYVADGPEKHTKELYRGPGDDWRLTTAERKRILLKNIYGVDIDPQAVEVTKLSLLLKVLEGENDQTLSRQLKLIHERALPDLGSNIKCGNSLIGPDFYEGKQLTLLDEEERMRINVFDWEKEFAEIMGNGGFDAVIGNPPYGASYTDSEGDYFSSRFTVFRGVKDVYAFFIEKMLSLLNRKGKFSFIVPSAWLGGPEYRVLRELLLQSKIENIILLPFDVFKDAYIDTTVFVLSIEKSNGEKVRTFIFGKKEKLKEITLKGDDYHQVDSKLWRKHEDKKFVLDPNALEILERVTKSAKSKLGDIVEIKRGVLFNKNLLLRKKTSTASHKYFEGDVYRYQLNFVAPNWVEFDERMKERPKEFKWFEGPRLLIRRLVNRRQRLMATFALETFVTNKNLYSLLLRDNKEGVDLLFILGVLNSRLASYLYINQVTQATKDDFPQVTIEDISKLLIHYPADKACHDRMVALVEHMLELHKQLTAAKTDHEKTALQRQIEVVDQQIDNLVYELYGLTEEERGIVEGGSRIEH